MCMHACLYKVVTNHMEVKNCNMESNHLYYTTDQKDRLHTINIVLTVTLVILVICYQTVYKKNAGAATIRRLDSKSL